VKNRGGKTRQGRGEHDQGLSKETWVFDLTQIKAYFRANRTKLNQHLTNSQLEIRNQNSHWGRGESQIPAFNKHLNVNYMQIGNVNRIIRATEK